MGALILQQLHDLTNSQAVEALALNVGWHYGASRSQVEDRKPRVCETRPTNGVNALRIGPAVS